MQIFLSTILKNALLWFILAAFHTTAETKTFENENEIFLWHQELLKFWCCACVMAGVLQFCQKKLRLKLKFPC